MTKNDEEVDTLEIPYLAAKVQIPVTPLVIPVIALSPYGSTQVVPWRYDPKVYRQGQESSPQVINEPNVTTIAGPGGMAHSGRVFALAEHKR